MPLPVPESDAFGNPLRVGDRIAVARGDGIWRGTITRLGPGWIYLRSEVVGYGGATPVAHVEDTRTQNHLVVRLDGA